MAESIIGKTEAIRLGFPWRSLEAAEYATLEWVDWFNNRRLLGPIGDIPPAEFAQRVYLTPDLIVSIDLWPDAALSHPALTGTAASGGSTLSATVAVFCGETSVR
jgi:hypothetical protein